MIDIVSFRKFGQWGSYVGFRGFGRVHNPKVGIAEAELCFMMDGYLDGGAHILVAILAVSQGNITATADRSADEAGAHSIDLPCHALEKKESESASEGRTQGILWAYDIMSIMAQLTLEMVNPYMNSPIGMQKPGRRNIHNLVSGS